MSQELDLSHLSPEKQALFRLLLEQEEAAGQPEPILTARSPDTELMPLTYAQKGACFIDWSSPDTPANSPLVIQITGSLNATLLAQSFTALIGRHEILRTQCLKASPDEGSITGTFYQKVLPPWQLSLTVEVLADISAAAQESEISRVAIHEATQPIDIANGRPLRCRLLQLGQEQFILLLTLHYFAVDGWSIRLLLKELFDDYTARITGMTQTAPVLPLQYADFAIMQRQWVESAAMQREIEFWQQQLHNLPAPLDLPTDHARPHIQTYNGAKSYFAIDEEVAQALVEMSRQAEVTLFMTLLAAVKTLLWHITRQADLMIGIITSNRQHVALEQLIGNFGNQIPLRTNLSDNPTFLDLLGRVREVAHAVFAHQQIPTEELISALKIPRDRSRPPLCPVTFVLHHAPMLPDVDGLALTLRPVEVITAPYEISLAFFVTANKLTATLQYNTDLFDEHTITGWISALQTILANVVANPNAPIATLLPPTALPFVQRNERALTPNGKIEPRALLTPSNRRPDLDTPYAPPRDAYDSQLVALWEEVLGIKGIGIHDDFFELGGHSIALMSLLSQIKGQFEQEIAVMTFLQEPTIEKIAAKLQDAADSEESVGAVTKKESRLLKLDAESQELVRHYLEGQAIKLREPSLKQRVLDYLPFSSRVKLFTLFVQRNIVQKRFFRQERELMSRFLEAAGLEEHNPSDLMTLYLMRFLCKHYCRGVLARSSSPLPDVRISGQEILTEASKQGQGLILLGIHTLFPSGVLPIILQHFGYDKLMQYVGVTVLEQNPTLFRALQQYFGDEEEAIVKAKFLSGQLDATRRILTAGGIVRITADGSSGSGIEITLPVLGRQGSFKTGFAELALSTGATVIPINALIERRGQIKISFHPPLDRGSPAMPHEERVMGLMKQYVAFLEECWRTEPANIHLEMMKRYLTWPSIS